MNMYCYLTGKLRALPKNSETNLALHLHFYKDGKSANFKKKIRKILGGYAHLTSLGRVMTH